MIKFECEACGKSATSRPTRYKKTKHHCCSIRCAAVFRRRLINCKCSNCGRVYFVGRGRYNRQIHHFCSRTCWLTFRHTGYVRPDGYRKITVNGKGVFEHRHVMAQSIGRPLRRNEQVHHGPRGRAYNDPTNLSIRLTGNHPNGHNEQELADWLRSIGWTVKPPARLETR